MLSFYFDQNILALVTYIPNMLKCAVIIWLQAHSYSYFLQLGYLPIKVVVKDNVAIIINVCRPLFAQ